MNDINFIAHIISEICNYAVKNNLEPNDTLDSIADGIKGILQICTFNGWELKDEKENSNER